MHINIFIGDFRFGGAEVVGVNLANSYASMGYQVTVLTLKNRGNLSNRLQTKIKIKTLNSRLITALPGLGKELKILSKQSHIVISTIRNLNILLAIANLIWCGGNANLLMREANTYSQLKNGTIKDKFTFYLYKEIIPRVYKTAIQSDC